MTMSSQEVYEKFLDFCSISLKGENPKFLDLIKSRYEGCDDDFCSSNEMVQLLEKTQRNMSSEESRKFVHLKDLLTELKINASATKKKKNKKRKHSSDLETENGHPEKVTKLKDFSVMVEKFPNCDTDLLDQDVSSMKLNVSPEFHIRKACSIADGNFNCALNIAVADDDQVENLKEELGSGLEYHNGSPVRNLEPSSSVRVDCRSSKILTRLHDDSYDSDSSLHTSHISDSIRGKSPRKSVSIVGIDDIAEECWIRTGTLGCYNNDDSLTAGNLLLNDNNNVQESGSWQVENRSCEAANAELKTPNIESPLKTLNTRTESPRKKSTFIVDVKLSNSPNMLIIESSSSCKRHIKEFSSTKDDMSKSLQLNCMDSVSPKSAALACEGSQCLETENVHSVHSSTELDDLSALRSTNRSEESILETLSGAVSQKEPNHKLLDTPDSPSYTSASITTETTNFESETTLEPQGQSSDGDHGSLNYETKSVCDDSAVLTLDVKISVDKSHLRVPLLSSTKIVPPSNSLLNIKPYTHGRQEKAAQEPKSFSTDCKASSSWMEDNTLESGASADEFQKVNKEHSISLDKNKLKQKKQVAKLERLLGSLRDEIEKCQDTEMALEDLDDENTAYIYEDKLKRKFVAVWNKLCEITERSVTTGRPTERTVRYSGTRYREINRRIEKFLNKKKVFPDFHDINSIVKLTNKKCKLNLSAVMINDIAREAFLDIGEMLQTRRHQDFIATFGTRQTDALRNSTDPYLADIELRRAVDSNRNIARLNLDNVIAKYTNLQYDRNRGDEGEDQEAVESGDKDDDDEMGNKPEKTNAERKDKRHKESVNRDFEDFVTSESIEVDMAEEIDDRLIDCGISDTCSTSQQPAAKYNPTEMSLGRSPYLLTPVKGKSVVIKSAKDHDITDIGSDITDSSVLGDPSCIAEYESGSVVSGKEDKHKLCLANSVIVIDESPSKSQADPWQASSFKVVKNDKESSNFGLEKTNHNTVGSTQYERKGPNIKYTARKPMIPSGELVQNKKERDCFQASDCDFSKKACENVRISTEDEDDDEEEEEDQSSDSTSEQDADDKNVDDDVDEIVMIINRSESECDTASSRSPSPISVVSLSSDSLDDPTGSYENYDDRHVDEIVSAVKESANNKHMVSSFKSAGKHGHAQNEKDSLEKRLFLHAMGIEERETEAPLAIGLTSEKICTVEPEDSMVLNRVIEPEETTTSNQNHDVINLDSTAVNQQGKSTAEKECFIVQDSYLIPEKRASPDSFDSIIHDEPKKTLHETEASADIEEINFDSEIVDKITGTSGAQAEMSKSERGRYYLHSSAEGTNYTEELQDIISDNTVKEAYESSSQSGQNDHEIVPPKKEIFEVNQKMLEDRGNKEFSTNTEMDAVEMCDIVCLQSALQDSVMVGEFKNSTADNNSSIKSGHVELSCKLQAVPSCDAKSEVLEQSSEDTIKNAKLSLNESVGALKKDTRHSSEVPETVSMTDGKVLTSAVQTDLENQEVSTAGKTSHTKTESVCNKLAITNREDTVNLNKNTSVKHYSNVQKDQPRTDSAEASHKPQKDTAVVILDDSSVDSCTQSSSHLSLISCTMPQMELPVCTKISSPVKKYNTYSTEEIVIKDYESSCSFQASCNQNAGDSETHGSYQEVADRPHEAVQESHEDEQKSSLPLVPCSEFKVKKDSLAIDHAENIMSENIATVHSVMKDVKLGQNDLNQRLPELHVENKGNHVHKPNISNPHDSIEFLESGSNTAEEKLLAESSKSGKKNTTFVWDNISNTAIRFKYKGQEVEAGDRGMSKVCVTGEEMISSEHVSCTSIARLNVVEAPREIKYQNTSKQSVENLPQDLFEDSASKGKDDGMRKETEVRESAISPDLRIDQLMQQHISLEDHRSVGKQQTDESLSNMEGLKDKKIFVEKPQDVATPTISLCDVNVIVNDSIQDSFHCSVLKKHECHSSEDERRTDENVYQVDSLENGNVKDIKSHGLSDRTDETEAAVGHEDSDGDRTDETEAAVGHEDSDGDRTDETEVAVGHGDRNMSSETVSTGCNIIGNDKDSNLCDSSGNDGDTTSGDSAENEGGSNLCGRVGNEENNVLCDNLENDGNSILCENGGAVLCNMDINMSTIKDKNMHEKVIKSTENEAAETEKNIAGDEKCEKSKDNSMTNNTVEDKSLEQVDKMSKSDSDEKKGHEVDNNDGDDSVDLLSTDSQSSKVVVESGTGFSQNTKCSETINPPGNTSGQEHFDTESGEGGCNLDTDVSSREAGSQRLEDGRANMQQSSLVIPVSHSISQDSVTAEAEEYVESNAKNDIFLTRSSDTVGDSFIVELNLADHKEDSTNVMGENDKEHEITDHSSNKDVMVLASSDTESSEFVNIQVSKIQAVNERKDDEDVSVIKQTENTSGCKQAELMSLNEEDEIKIIEELSSVRGVRCSENSKEDDRRLVDQILLDLEHNKSKGIKVSSESNTSLAGACQISGECWEINDNAETEGNIDRPSMSFENALPEKSDDSLHTNSLSHSSVLNVECEEVHMNEGELSPPSVPTSQSQAAGLSDSQARVRNSKRLHEDSHSGGLSNRAKEHNSGDENEATSKSVIDVEMIPQPKKQKIIKPDFITDIISSVLSEFPPGVKSSNLPSSVAKSKPQTKSTVCSEKTPSSLFKSSEQGGDEDDDVVIMEETPPSSTHHPVYPAALQQSKNLSPETPVVFKKQSSSCSYTFSGKTMSPSTSPLQHKKHSVPPTRGNYASPSSFQSQSHVHSNGIYNKRSSVASKNQPPLFVRPRGPLTPTLIGSNSRTLPQGKVVTSHSPSLPSLRPRVPIPNIEPSRTSEFTRMHQRHHTPGVISTSFPNRRSPLSGSGNIRVPPMACPDIRQRIPNISLSRNKSITPSMVPNLSRSGITHHSTGRLNSYQKQSASGVPHNTVRHMSCETVPSHSLHQEAPVHSGMKRNAARCRNSQQRVLDGLEIILGDSDDEEEFNNTSSGLRIVSVASLSSTQCMVNTSHDDHNNVPNTRVEDQPHKRNRDVIVIPD